MRSERIFPYARMEEEMQRKPDAGWMGSDSSRVEEPSRSSLSPDAWGERPRWKNTHGLYMSASMSTVDAPDLERRVAMFTAKVDLPMPPLPETTLIIFFGMF